MLVQWWNSVQPAFRQSNSGMPMPIYTSTDNKDPWNQLRRAGPNGLISIVTMLGWWGNELSRRSQWHEDSSGLWKQMVIDVEKVMTIVKSVSGGVRKRKGGCLDNSNLKK